MTGAVRDALYDLVHDHPGGGPALAARMKLAASTLLSMANPHCESHDWSLKRFEQALALTGDLRPLDALCQQFGGVFIRMGRFDHLPPGRLLKEAQHLAKEFGDVPVRLAEIIADGTVKPREVELLRREVYEMQAAGAALMRVVEEISIRHVNVPEDERPG